ncbi:alpha/beta hydrolase [Candidatus Accumulibacter sp. ACC003]|uniref:esterase/lipase family protein n=1 Tax=Candidatus Accumulibacter sp. ACC003 TaxID=2823334 RepID=UPI0025BF420C|nr:alpha/beta hydrolase [Candidatus Accumulibacter sp. ACC003]
MLINRRPDLQKIAGCDDPRRAMDVVFVHGLGGDSWTTWMADKDNIGSFWPNWLAEDVPGLGIWTLGYAASGSKWKEESMPLADRGNQVLDLLSIEGLGQRPLAFISHSMGGIVVKQILRNAD